MKYVLTMSDKRPPFRVGVVGAGFGSIIHVPAFRAHKRFDVIAIASPNRAGEVAREQAIPHAFTSCEEMLDGVELDLVSIASPPFAHHADVCAALARNKHVLCEKPLALNLAQAEDLFARARSAGVVCATAFEFRYLPAILAIRELIANEHLGALRHIEVALIGSKLRATVERPNSWWFDAARGGGVANGYMPHLFDIALGFADRAPRDVRGFLRTANPQRHSAGATFTSTVADGAFSILDFGEGLAATVTTDHTRSTDSTLIAVHGEKRTVVASGKSLQQTTTFIVDENETAELELLPNAHANLAIAHPSLPFFLSLLDDMLQAMEGKSTTIPTFAEGLAAQRCLEAIGYTSR
jgi:predicted dehydrogenase